MSHHQFRNQGPCPAAGDDCADSAGNDLLEHGTYGFTRRADAGTTPLRLPLGNDAADAIAASLGTTRAELAAWEHVTRSTGIGQ